MIKMAVRAGVRSMLGDTARAFHIFTDPFVNAPATLFVHDLAYNVHRLAGAAADEVCNLQPNGHLLRAVPR